MLWFVLALAAQPIVLEVRGDCASATVLAAVVNERAGNSSVVESGDRTVVVRYRPLDEDGGVSAEVTLTVDGVARGARRLGPFRTCQGLEDALALTLALIVDPLAAAPAMSPAPPPPAPPAPPPPAAEVVLAPTRENYAHLRVQGSAELGVGAGFAPGFGPTALLRLRFGVGAFGIGVGARFDQPRPLVLDAGRRLETGGAAAVVDACWVRSIGSIDVEGCGAVDVGGLRVVGIGFTQPDPTVVQVVAAGGALGLNVPLFAGLAVHTRLGVSTPLLGARLIDGPGDVVWKSPPLGFMWVVGISAGRFR